MAKRARSQRRSQERALRKDVRAREKLAALGPGGGPDRAYAIPSASLVEPTARSIPCIQCGGTLDLTGHAAAPDAPLLRIARLVCRLCHTPREIWFRIEAAGPN
jgi:hypothetical protein